MIGANLYLESSFRYGAPPPQQGYGAPAPGYNPAFAPGGPPPGADPNLWSWFKVSMCLKLLKEKELTIRNWAKRLGFLTLPLHGFTFLAQVQFQTLMIMHL